MATTYNQDIQKLYVAYFNRPADPAGLAYWEGVVEAAGGKTDAVSAAFAGSAEYTAAYANMTNADIVNQVYLNLFGRPAEDAGKAYWADLLDKKTLTIDNVVKAVADGALTTDKVAFDSKVSFAGAFTAAIDTDAEKAGYTGDAANAAAKALVSSITDAVTLAAAEAPATLNASVANVVAIGTPFTVTGALASYQAAQTALTNFVDAYDGKADGVLHTDAATIAGADVTAGEAEVGALINVNGNTAATYAAGSAAVKAAILSDQVAFNAADLATAQGEVAKANADIAKVAGLSAAEATLASATTAAGAADKALLATQADLAAKIASYNVTHNLTGTAALVVQADGTVQDTAATPNVYITVDSNNNLVLNSAASIKEDSAHAGITNVLNSSIAELAAASASTKAHAVEASAQVQVDYLDMNTGEAAALQTVKGLLVDVTVGATALPTEAQMATQLAIFNAEDAAAAKVVADVTASGGTPTAAQNQAATDAHTAAVDFKNAVDAYHGLSTTNDLTHALDLANTHVSNAQDTIDALSGAVADQSQAYSDAAQVKALQDAITAAGKVITSHDLVLPVTATGSLLASAASDIFVAGSTDASISLFGLLGQDSLFVGSNYVLNTGKLSAGNDAQLEVFVSQSGTDTLLKIEKHAFSSHVTGAAAPEIVTITLVGTTATDVHLDNGIITVGAPHA